MHLDAGTLSSLGAAGATSAPPAVVGAGGLCQQKVIAHRLIANDKDSNEPDAWKNIFTKSWESLSFSTRAYLRYKYAKASISDLTRSVEHVFAVAGFVQVDSAGQVHPLRVPPEVAHI